MILVPLHTSSLGFKDRLPMLLTNKHNRSSYLSVMVSLGGPKKSHAQIGILYGKVKLKAARDHHNAAQEGSTRYLISRKRFNIDSLHKWRLHLNNNTYTF